MNDKFDSAKKEVKERVAGVRFRAWSLTLVILVAIILYILVNVAMQQKMNVIDFIFLSTIQILAHCVYFPEGDIFGQKNKSFIENKKQYNIKANNVYTEHRYSQLREFCRYDYIKRKNEYVEIELGDIGITLQDLEAIKEKSKKEIKHIEFYEYTNNDGVHKIYFSRQKRKKLYNLIFLPIPIEENDPQTIMSAVENGKRKKIRDTSIIYNFASYIKKFICVIFVGLILSYMGYTLKDGISFVDIVKLVMFITSLFSTMVTSFSSGEQSSRVYKNNFYIELCNFLDAFYEWATPVTIEKQIKESEN